MTFMLKAKADLHLDMPEIHYSPGKSNVGSLESVETGILNVTVMLLMYPKKIF